MNTLTIDIRKAEPRDAAAIAEVHLEAWRGAYTGIIPHRALISMINRRGAEWWANAIRRAATVLVVEMGGKIAGYTTIGRNRVKELRQQGEIYELYLLPEYQGIGPDGQPVRRREPGDGERDGPDPEVWALEENENAVSFYAGAGGRDIAEGVEIFEQKALKKIAFVWE